MTAQPAEPGDLSGSEAWDHESGLIRLLGISGDAYTWLERHLCDGEYGGATKTATVNRCKAQDSLTERQEKVVSIDQ